MQLSWRLARLGELSPFDVHALLALRSRVFVVEQTCIFLDADDADLSAHHLLGRDPDNRLVALLRLVDPGIKYDEPSMGRVITAPEVRGTGLGRMLVAEGIARARQIWPGQGIRISAQARLERFYAGFGFATIGQPYLEDDIPHLEMLLPPA